MHTLYTFVSIMSRWTTHEHRRPLRSVKHETGTNLKPVCGCPLVANGNLDHICYRFRDSDENWNRRFLSYWRDSYSPVLRESSLGTGVLNLVPKKAVLGLLDCVRFFATTVLAKRLKQSLISHIKSPSRGKEVSK